MSSNLPRLRYFMFPGRAYAARVSLFNSFGKDGWIDERISQGAFKKLKSQSESSSTTVPQQSDSDSSDSVKLTTNNLPQLILPNGLVFTQSHAIARWAARQQSSVSQYCLYPNSDSEQDLQDALLIDETMALVDSVVGLAPKDSDKEIRLQKRADYADIEKRGPLALGLKIMETRLASKYSSSSGSPGGGPYLLGENLSLADLYLKKPLTDMILDKQFEGVEPSYLENNFPSVLEHTRAVGEHPLVVEYLKHYKN